MTAERAVHAPSPELLAPKLLAFLAKLRVGASTRIGSDAFVPLFFDAPASADSPPLDFELLEESLLAGRTELREVSEGGDVNRIRVRHDGTRPLLLLDGEQIVGAKQNRILNASFVVPSGSEVELPVSCVERGRWRYASSTFSASGTTLTGMARSRKVSRVTHSVMVGHGYDAEQGAVWRDVDEYLEHSQVVSRTAALDDGMRTRRDSIKRALERLHPEPGQVGVALVRDGELLLIDAFGSAKLYARVHQKVLRGMLADTRMHDRAPAGARRAVSRTLAALADADEHRAAAPGSGETLHASAGRFAVSAVADAGRVIHAVVGAA